jgi:acetate kinase
VLDDRDRLLASASVDAAPDGAEARDALERFLERIGSVDAVGHRIVHGGPRLTRPRIVDDEVRAALDEAADLAPLHVPPALAALDQVRRALPAVPQVVCFDTTFHATLPPAARTYAVPRGWRERYGIRRYGFHGLSYTWALRRTAELLGRPTPTLQVVLAHLAGGASVCAVRDGASVWTSMGFTPLEGLVMAKRSGSVDPGMLLWLQTQRGLGVQELANGLQQHGGLIALTDGRSGDTREIVRLAAAGDEQAQLALDVYVLRIRQEVAAAAASLPSLDALVFTGEIGADQPEVREAVCAGLPVLGLAGELDPSQDDDGVLSRADAAVAVLLVHPREDRQIAAEVQATLA